MEPLSTFNAKLINTPGMINGNQILISQFDKYSTGFAGPSLMTSVGGNGGPQNYYSNASSMVHTMNIPTQAYQNYQTSHNRYTMDGVSVHSPYLLQG